MIDIFVKRVVLNADLLNDQFQLGTYIVDKENLVL